MFSRRRNKRVPARPPNNKEIKMFTFIYSLTTGEHGSFGFQGGGTTSVFVLKGRSIGRLHECNWCLVHDWGVSLWIYLPRLKRSAGDPCRWFKSFRHRNSVSSCQQDETIVALNPAISLHSAIRLIIFSVFWATVHAVSKPCAAAASGGKKSWQERDSSLPHTLVFVREWFNISEIMPLHHSLAKS